MEKKNIINLSSAELDQKVVKVKNKSTLIIQISGDR